MQPCETPTLPRMTFASALASEWLRLRTSPLAALHLVCPLAGALVCGAYFSVATIWDMRFGMDAYIQLLGALMPLMAGIVCALATDAEREAGLMANLLAIPSRSRAVLAKVAVLFLMGAAALALAVLAFVALLAATGRVALDPAMVLRGIAGLVLGSLPLYPLMTALSIRFGRNIAIGAGAAGLLVAFLSVGGLAHGLMTGELTGTMGGMLSWIPFAWPAKLGSLGVEAVIAAGTDRAAAVGWCLALFGGLAAASAAVLGAALTIWFARFEDRGERE